MNNIAIGILVIVVLIILIENYWSFLSPWERKNLLEWVWMHTWIPDWIVCSDWFCHLYIKTTDEAFRKMKGSG